jgi:hypothetical protein
MKQALVVRNIEISVRILGTWLTHKLVAIEKSYDRLTQNIDLAPSQHI